MIDVDIGLATLLVFHGYLASGDHRLVARAHLQEVLHTTALSWRDWGLLTAIVVPAVLSIEIVKWWRWRAS